MNLNRLIPAIAFLISFLLTEKTFSQSKVIINNYDTVVFDVQPDETEYRILAEFYSKLNGRKWKNNRNWLKGKTSVDMAKWFGVVVRDGDVSEIHLPNNKLSGTLPKTIFKLAQLRALVLDGNTIKTATTAKKTQTTTLATQSTATSSPIMYSQATTQSSTGVNLPVWGLAVDGNHTVSVDFRSGKIAQMPNSGASRVGCSGVAITPCGAMALYFLHSGTDALNQLHIYKSDGTRLTTATTTGALRALNSAAGNVELQVVPVPNRNDEWYVIYSKFYNICLTSPPSSGYCPAQAVYTKIKYNATDGLVINESEREVSISSSLFTQGKAVSRTRPGGPGHYLYMAERVNDDYIRIHRYTIDGTGIHSPELNASLIPAKKWPASIAGSTVELSPDETKLAITNRNVGQEIAQDFIIFELNKFNTSGYTGVVVSIPNLVIAGTGISIKEAATYSGSEEYYNPCFIYLKNKISQLEFSPSGRYVYLTHGGYVDGTGNIPYNTYLLQVDLNSGTGTGDYEVRMRIERGYGVTDNDADCLGADGALSLSTMTSQIQTAYDGRLYFSKGNYKLYVIPNPDAPMTSDFIAGSIDFSSADYPNLTMPDNDRVSFMPENIDGYDYIISEEPTIDSEFTMDKTEITNGGQLTVTVNNMQSNLTYLISWGDGQKVTFVKGSSSSVAKTHNYYTAGDKTVTLTVTNGSGCSASTSKALTVTTCTFDTPSSYFLTARQYRCATKFNVTKIDDCYASYVWDFGDNTPTSKERAPMHVYGAPGTYTASVTITYNCFICSAVITKTKQVTITQAPPLIGSEVVDLTTEQKFNVINTSASSFSETWPLDHQEPALEDLNEFANGSQGVWRTEGSFVYQKDRSSSVSKSGPQPPAQVNLQTDGTYPLLQFNWANAHLDPVPDWIRTNTMTRYNAYGYELENVDPLNIYSAALYDYGGQLQSAYGINMRNDEMAFTGFETNGDIVGGDAFENKPNGNLIFAQGDFPFYSVFNVTGGRAYVAIVEGKLSEFDKATKADITARGYVGALFSFLRSETRYVQNAKILCKEAHPQDANKTILVFDKAPFEGVWKGQIRIKNKIVPLLNAAIGQAVAHTGTKSLQITGDVTFEQKLLHLIGGKSYHFSAWASVNNVNLTAPKLADRISVDIILKDITGKTISITSVVPEGKIIEGWQQVKGSFTCPENNLVLSLRFKKGTATSVWFDDLRLHPDDGNMKSYVYDLQDLKLKAILDENNFASMFYYDKEGNLFLTKKETEEGIKTITENISYQVGDN
jgi:PKD repeat protein